MNLEKPLPRNEATIFLHIPKTAGTTLEFLMRRQAAEENYCLVHNPEDMNDLPEHRRAKIRMLIGHFCFGIHEYLSGPWHYITIVRNPFKRVRSLYDQARRRSDHNMHKVVNKYTLRELFEKKLHLEAIDNSQVRMISGVWDTVPFGGVDKEVFDLAIHNLDRHFACYGTTERFDETLLIFQDKLGWKDIYCRPLNRARKHKGEVSDYDKDTFDIVTKSNQWDQALYNHVDTKLSAEIDKVGSRFGRRLFWLRVNRYTWGRFYWRVARKVCGR